MKVIVYGRPIAETVAVLSTQVLIKMHCQTCLDIIEMMSTCIRRLEEYDDEEEEEEEDTMENMNIWSCMTAIYQSARTRRTIVGGRQELQLLESQ
jgi:hypothetical protein